MAEVESSSKTLLFSGIPKGAQERHLFGMLYKTVGKQKALNRVKIQNGTCEVIFPTAHAIKILELQTLEIFDSKISVVEVQVDGGASAAEESQSKNKIQNTQTLKLSNIPKSAELKHLFYTLTKVVGPLDLKNKVQIDRETCSCKVVLPRIQALKIYIRRKQLILFEQPINVSKIKAEEKTLPKPVSPKVQQQMKKASSEASSAEIRVEVANIPKMASVGNILGAIRKQYGEITVQTNLVKINQDEGTCILMLTEDELNKLVDMNITVFDNVIEFTIPQKKEYKFTLKIPDNMDANELCSHVEESGLIVRREMKHSIEVEALEETLFNKLMSTPYLNQHILPVDVFEFNKTLNVASGSKCLVFWDFENCNLGENPQIKSVVKYVNLLQTAINCVCGYSLADISIKAIGNTALLPEITRQVFDRQNITSIDVPQRKKEAADKRILTEICLDMVESISSGTTPILVLISGDADFNGMVTKLRMRGHLGGLIICAETRISAADYHDPTNIDCFMRHEKLWEYSCIR